MTTPQLKHELRRGPKLRAMTREQITALRARYAEEPFSLTAYAHAVGLAPSTLMYHVRGYRARRVAKAKQNHAKKGRK